MTRGLKPPSVPGRGCWSDEPVRAWAAVRSDATRALLQVQRRAQCALGAVGAALGGGAAEQQEQGGEPDDGAADAAHTSWSFCCFGETRAAAYGWSTPRRLSGPRAVATLAPATVRRRRSAEAAPTAGRRDGGTKSLNCQVLFRGLTDSHWFTVWLSGSQSLSCAELQSWLRIGVPTC